MRNPLKASRFDEYPKLKRLINAKADLLARISHPPAYVQADLLPSTKPASRPGATPQFHLSSLLPIKYDAVIIDPPLESYEWEGAPSSAKYANEAWSWDQIAALPIPQIMAKESFIFLWVGSGAFDGLERGREVLSRWGYRRSEDIVWIQTNHESDKRKGEKCATKPSTSVFRSAKQHCLMGIRGTVRRRDDTRFVHCNIDTDVIVWEGDSRENFDPRAKPPELMDLVENFCLGTRRLELFGRNRNLRRGWLTVGIDVGPDRPGWDLANKGENACSAKSTMTSTWCGTPQYDDASPKIGGHESSATKRNTFTPRKTSATSTSGKGSPQNAVSPQTGDLTSSSKDLSHAISPARVNEEILSTLADEGAPHAYEKQWYDSYFGVDRVGATLIERRNLVPYSEEIDRLRPKSPPHKRGEANSTPPAPSRALPTMNGGAVMSGSPTAPIHSSTSSTSAVGLGLSGTGGPSSAGSPRSPLQTLRSPHALGSLAFPQLQHQHHLPNLPARPGGAGYSGLGAGGPTIVSVPSGSENLSGPQASVLLAQAQAKAQAEAQAQLQAQDQAQESTLAENTITAMGTRRGVAGGSGRGRARGTSTPISSPEYTRPSPRKT